MPLNVEELNVKITSDASTAVDSIDRLIASLERLNAVDLGRFLNSFNSLRGLKFDNAADFGALANKLRSLGKVADEYSASFQKLSGMGYNLAHLGQAAAGMGNVSNIAAIGQAFANIGKLNPANLELIGDGFTKMVQSISTSSVPESVIELIGRLASVIASLASKTGKRYEADFTALANGLERLFQVLARAPTLGDGTVRTLEAVSKLSTESVRAAKGLLRLSEAATSGSNSFLRFGQNAKVSNNSIRSFTTRLAFTIGKFRQIFFLARRLATFFSKMVKSSMEYVETLNYFNAAFDQVASRSSEIFGDAGEEAGAAFANRFAAEAAKVTEKMSGYSVNSSGMVTNTMGTTLGMNPALMMQYQATFAQMASSMGVSSDMATDLSRALTEIGADLASVKNLDFEDTWKNLQSGLVGMSRAVDKYGLNIRNVNLQQKLTQLGIEANIQSMNQQDKALLRTIIILENSQYAWGDLADTLQQPANQMRMLQSGMANLGRTIGNLLLPVVASALPYINAFVVALQKLVELLVTAMGFEFDWGSAGGAVIDSEWADYLDDTADSLGNATEAAKEWQNQLLGFDEINKLGSESSDDSESELSNALVTGQLEDALRAALDAYQRVWDASYENVNNRVNEMAQAIVDAFQEGDFKKIGSKVSGWIIDGLNGINWDDVKTFAYTVGEKTADFLNGALTPEMFATVGRTFAEVLNAAVQRALGFGENFNWGTFGKGIGTGISNFLLTFDFKSLVSAFNAFVRGFATALLEAFRNVKWGEIIFTLIDALITADPIAIAITVGALTFKPVTKAVFSAFSASITGLLAQGLAGITTALGPVGLAVGGGLLITTALGIVIHSIKAQADEEAFRVFYESIAPVAASLDEALGGLTDFGDSISASWKDVDDYCERLNLLTKRFNELQKKTNLTALEQAELNTLTQTLSDELPGFTELIDEETGAYKGTTLQLERLTKAHENYMRQQAMTKIMQEYIEKQAEVGLKMYQTRQEIDKLRPVAEAYNEMVKNQAAYSAETWNAALMNLIATHSELGIETEDDLIRISASYAHAQDDLRDYQTEWNNVTAQITDIQNYSNAVVTSFDDIDRGIKKGTEQSLKTAKESGRSLAHAGFLKGFDEAMQIESPSKAMIQRGAYIVEGLANGLTALKPLNNALTNLFNTITGAFSFDRMRGGLNGVVTAFNSAFGDAANAALNQYNSMASSMNTATVNNVRAVNFSKVPMLKYANGGFPEDGMFFLANSHELVGQFSNGRTAVANNEQIIAGIEGGVARGMAQAIMSTANVTGGTNGQPVQVVISVDSETLYRATLRGENKYNNRYHMTVR